LAAPEASVAQAELEAWVELAVWVVLEASAALAGSVVRAALAALAEPAIALRSCQAEEAVIDGNTIRNIAEAHHIRIVRLPTGLAAPRAEILFPTVRRALGNNSVGKEAALQAIVQVEPGWAIGLAARALEIMRAGAASGIGRPEAVQIA
jgi:putative cofactor-binding repeat protein